METAEFLQTCHGAITVAIDDDGFTAWGGSAYAWMDPGELHVLALACPPEQAWQVALLKCAEPECAHMIFGLDRYGKPEQGTILGDVVAGFYYERGAPTPFRPFIVEYTMKPEKRVLWFNWTNEFWCAAIEFERLQSIRLLRKMIEQKEQQA